MKRSFFLFLLMLAFSGTIFSGSAAASYIAYNVPAQSGNQMYFAGALGMDFDVNAPITLLALGVFDSDQDGLARQITAHVYDRDTKLPVVTVVFEPGATGTLTGGSRFLLLSSPILLPTGFHGSIVAENYGLTEPNGNSSMAGWTLSTLDDGGGLISFVGTSRWGVEQGELPEVLGGREPNMFGAGTFLYEATGVPEPTTLVLCGSVVCLIFCLRKFNRRIITS